MLHTKVAPLVWVLEGGALLSIQAWHSVWNWKQRTVMRQEAAGMLRKLGKFGKERGWLDAQEGG